MTDANSPDSPLEAAAEMTGPRATEAFSVLGNETRMAILLALWEAYEPFAEGPTDYAKGNEIPFSELRERVGMRDSGQFNYHLDKVAGRFVRKTDDGYELLPAGERVVRTVIASAGFERQSYPPTEIDVDCPYCGATTGIIYQNYRLYHVCTECAGRYDLGDDHPSGVLNAWKSNQAVLSHPSARAILSAGSRHALHQYALRCAGICSWCSGQIDPGIHVCDAHDRDGDEPCPACNRRYEVAVRLVCTVCKATNILSIIGVLLILQHPVVAEYYREHGVELDYTRYDSETVSLYEELAREVEHDLISSEPLVVQVTIPHEDDKRTLLIDEELNVTDVSERN